MTDESINRPGGWKTLGSTVICVGAVLLLTAADCGTEESVDHRDVASDSAKDAGTADASDECRTVDQSSSCRRRSGCHWLSVTCDDGQVVSGCFDTSRDRVVSVSCRTDAGTAGDRRDAGADTGSGCGRFGDRQTCDAQPQCWWWAPRCADASTEPRCLQEGSVPDESMTCTGLDVGGVDAGDTGGEAGDAGLTDDAAPGVDGAEVGVQNCRALGHESSCSHADGCKWWTAICHGETVKEACVSVDSYPTPPKCKTTRANNCYKVPSKQKCGGPNCEWVAEGCGLPSAGTLEVQGCLPSGTCQAASDCPTGHACATVWVKPCHGGGCNSCGIEERRCVPNGLLNP